MSLRAREIVGAGSRPAPDGAAAMRASAAWGKQAPHAAGAPSSAASAAPGATAAPAPFAGVSSNAVESASPILILTIANGAGHTRAAQAIAEAISLESGGPSCVVDVADHMDAVTRFTHVTAYLWLVRHAPAVWGRVDRYQKRQMHTSPEWFYRRGCRSLFDLARRLRPRALVATEVGCCEIAALVKRDLSLDVPLVAVNVCYDADRAWVQAEVDLYTVMTEDSGARLRECGAPPDRIGVWGAPLSAEFAAPRGLEDGRAQVCRALRLNEKRPLVLVGGGGEGLGQIEASLLRLLALGDDAPQVVVLAGRNAKLKVRCERLAERARSRDRVRVLGWMEQPFIAKLMRAGDVLVSKCGNTFDEAVASELPLVALEPPPGSERVQYGLLEEWGTGRAVRTPDELAEAVRALLADDGERARMRERCRAHRRTDAARRIARWLAKRDGSTAEHETQPDGRGGTIARRDEIVSYG